jgi:aspartate/methionine/tyrosine aminotransferase
MVFPKDHAKPLINLGLGEPSKANGFTLPSVINEALIEVVQSEQHNGYTAANGALPAR